MKHVKLFEDFSAEEFLRKQENYKNEENKFLNIVNLLEYELEKNRCINDISHISKSKTDYGQSWYIIFNNGREIRISDHSVISNNRIMDSKYLSFINVREDFNKVDAERVISYYLKDKKILQQIIDDRNEKLVRKNIEENSKVFIEKLKSENKGIFNTNKTYMTIDELKIKHPDWEYIFQEPCQNAYQYTYIKEKNGYETYYLSKNYYNFLISENILK